MTLLSRSVITSRSLETIFCLLPWIMMVWVDFFSPNGPVADWSWVMTTPADAGFVARAAAASAATMAIFFILVSLRTLNFEHLGCRRFDDNRGLAASLHEDPVKHEAQQPQQDPHHFLYAP